MLTHLTREREPGTPWELGDRLSVTFTDEQGREIENVALICTATCNGRIVEAVSETAPIIHLTFSTEEE
jgi:hypothetical protein